jgi:hypothetical protein
LYIDAKSAIHNFSPPGKNPSLHFIYYNNLWLYKPGDDKETAGQPDNGTFRKKRVLVNTASANIIYALKHYAYNEYFSLATATPR